MFYRESKKTFYRQNILTLKGTNCSQKSISLINEILIIKAVLCILLCGYTIVGKFYCAFVTFPE